VKSPPKEAGASANAAHKKLTGARTLLAEPREINGTYGPPALCAWRVLPGVFWVQTTVPQFSRNLEKRQDTRRVGITGINHYRRTFGLRGTWRKIRRIIDRYLVSAGDQFSRDCRSLAAPKQRGSNNTAATSNRRRKAVWMRRGGQ
jgi:hypothetical protein